MTFRILIADGLSQAGIDKLKTAGEVVVNAKITPAELVADLPNYHALIVRSRTKVTADVLAAGSNLKVVGRAGVGVDNIDVAAAVARGVTVVNSPLAASVAVAELTLAMMLALARQVTAADASLKRNVWDKSALMGDELYGKTLGIVGLGRIGQEVGVRAAAFNMHRLAYDPFLSAEQIRERGAYAASLEDVLAKADYLSLHLPLTAQTRNLLNAERLAQMKKGARIICLARGGVIDEAALRTALDSGHLAGAGLDVFAQEPPEADGIATHPRVIATPHIGAQTREAQDRAGLAIATEVLTVLKGGQSRFGVTQND